MFGIANNTEFLTAIGINNAPEDVKAKLIAGIEDLAEKRLVIKISDIVTDEQAEQFGKITDEQEAVNWLNANIPNFQEIVTEVLAEIKNEILERKANVVGQSMTNPNNLNTNTPTPNRAHEWDSLKDYAGERNVNSKTGRPRTDSVFDLYPRQPGETPEEYGARIRFMQEATKEAEAAGAKREYLMSEQGQKEKAAEDEFARLSEKVDKAVEEGRMSKSHANVLLEKLLQGSIDEIDGLRQDYKDRQTVGPEEDQEAYQKWLETRANRVPGKTDASPEDLGMARLGELVEAEEDAREKTSEFMESVDKELERRKQQEFMESVDDELARRRNNAEGDQNKDKADFGEINLEKPEAAVGEDNAEQIKAAEIKAAEDELKAILPELAELYARNRRLVIGPKNRTEFVNKSGEYKEALDRLSKLKAKAALNTGNKETNEELQKRLDELTRQIEEKLLEFVGGDPENTEKTREEIDAEKTRLVEEANQILQSEYAEMIEKTETDVNVSFLNTYLEEANELEEATVKALDKGTLCRKFVNKVLNNKIMKGALIAAGVAGLAVTGIGLGVGLAAGTMSVGFGLTAGGFAAGAARGGLMGALMSRQNSKNSAVRGFTNEEEIKALLENVDVENPNTSNVANYLLEQYSSAKDQDLSSNRKRTAVSTGLGALIGGLMSGVQIYDKIPQFTTEAKQIGTTPGQIEPDLFNNVNIPKGGGAYNTFTQMGGNPNDLQKALDIMYNIDPKYGMVPGSNGETTGFNGLVGQFAHTYPGQIQDWPDVAQSYITEVAEEWARQGLIPSHTTGGEPIYSNVVRATTNFVPNAFMNILTQATTLATAGILGSKIGGAARSNATASSGENPPSNPEENPTKEETGDGMTPEEETGSAEEESTGAPEQPEENQGESSNPETEKDNFSKLVQDRLGNLIGEDGIEIMTNTYNLGDNGSEPLSPERITSWWSNLSQEAQSAVQEFLNEQVNTENAKYGGQLRVYLQQLQGQN